jgi:hypothetical protein
MSCQLRANEIRIEVLQDENQRLQDAMAKMVGTIEEAKILNLIHRSESKTSVPPGALQDQGFRMMSGLGALGVLGVRQGSLAFYASTEGRPIGWAGVAVSWAILDCYNIETSE